MYTEPTNSSLPNYIFQFENENYWYYYEQKIIRFNAVA